MPDFAKTVTIDQARGKLFVDGAEFPWTIPAMSDGIECHIDTKSRTSTVTVRFFAEAIEVIPVSENPQESAT